jgi:hypothetical protein
MTKTFSSPDWHRVACLLLTSRLLDKLEERELTPAGKIPYQFSAKGHELSQILLDTAIARRPYPGDNYILPFGQAALLAEGDSLTVVTWGAMTHRVTEAAQSHTSRVISSTCTPSSRGINPAYSSPFAKQASVSSFTRTRARVGSVRK